MNRVAEAIVQHKTYVIDLDLSAYFDAVRHHLLLAKVALRIQDPDVMRLLRPILKTSGRQGVPQFGVISPLLINIYPTEVDRMLERANATTIRAGHTAVEYARFADDLVVLVDAHRLSLRIEVEMSVDRLAARPPSRPVGSVAGDIRNRQNAVVCGLMTAHAAQGNRRGNSSISPESFLNEINSLGRRFVS